MRGLAVQIAGHGVISRVGTAGLRMLAFKSGLTGLLSGALRVPRRQVVHDRGQVLTDLATMIADGGTAIGHIRTLRDRAELFGPVASAPTAWRALQELTARRLDKVAVARAKARRRIWELIAARHGGIPASRTCYGDLGEWMVIRLDATIQVCHSDKESAAGTFKGTYGMFPLTAWLDNTGECLAVKLRPGNAGANTICDHIDVLAAAIAQIPPAYRRRVLVTVDGAGATIELLEFITTLNTRSRQVHYSVGFDLDERAKTAIAALPEDGWVCVLDDEGHARPAEQAGTAELTGLLRHSAGGDRLKNWPAGMRVLVRREKPGSGAKLSDFEKARGWRYQVIATNTSAEVLPVQRGESRHRVHARVEDFIRCGKDTGLARLPSWSFALNQAWCIAAAIGCDLLAWFRLLCCDGEMAAAEPGTLRYALLHTSARLVRGQRRRTIKIPRTWPWAGQLHRAIGAVLTMPAPT
ncbi:IS1380 family transposase [Nonomuraea basaltis]|uniref:IS1380 family transposase n=1 Tax=Nonomuraea basaltis TaxID=2495887 RepID=UPI00110C65A2|nr:IS1380 family transposase [Nonomuraea basaltis]TMR87922.1 IS1380 family transposase [Nonomuraea basaltis]